MFLTCLLQAVFASLAVAAYGFTYNEITSNPYHVAHVTQPMWHFASGSCYPQSANDNGNQHSPHLASGPNCVPVCPGGTDAGAGCANQIPWLGPNQKGVNVPTYYTVKHCDQDDTWRVYYGLYFDHDVGHSNDWEWVVVKFKNYGGTYYRESIIMEQDGENAEYNWKDPLVQTFMDDHDIWDPNNGADKNHPKVYVSKMHHSMWPNPCREGKDICESTFRVDDWYMFDFSTASNLVEFTSPVQQGGIDPNWNFGSATNPWKTDICGMCTVPGGVEADCVATSPRRCVGSNPHCTCPTHTIQPGPPTHPPPPRQKEMVMQTQEL